MYRLRYFEPLQVGNKISIFSKLHALDVSMHAIAKLRSVTYDQGSEAVAFSMREM
jgi:hypothetical protein